MAAYFRRRAAAGGGGSGGALTDEPYPALLVSGSAETASDPAMLHEKLYEFTTTSPGGPECCESRDAGDDVIDCCARHYQMALVDAAQRAQPPSLDTFRPGGSAAVVDTATSGAGGYGECCPLMGVQQRYNGAAATVLRLHDRRR